MVAGKGRLNPLTDRVTRDQTMGQVTNFKIYAEVEKVKVHDTQNNGTKGKIVPFDGDCYLSNANDSKSGIKNMEKNKGKQHESEPIAVNLNVRRKVLADIGNVKGRFSRLRQGKSSEFGKGKRERVPQSHRDAVDLGNTEASSSDKPSKGRERLELILAAEENQTLKTKPNNENIKATSDEPRTKFQGCNSVAATATSRKSVRMPLHLTRFQATHFINENIKATSDEPRTKFQGLLKQVSQVETGVTTKESSEKSEKFRGKHGFPGKLLSLSHSSQQLLAESYNREHDATNLFLLSVKPSSRRSILPKPSNLSSRPWGNRVSDGFVVMASGAQVKVDTGILSRKSVKPTVKTTIATLNTERNSKSNQNLATTKKLRSSPADLSKKKQEKVSSLSKDIPSVFSHEEPAPEKNVSGDNTSDIISRRKSDRRSSYTCSLISRPKLLKDSKVETLPNIYDDRNHLEVSDYVDDIYQYYWVMEAQNPLMKNYMEIQNEITPQMRGILINWLIEVHLKFELMEETLFLTVTLLDRYLSLECIKKNEMQLVGLTALLLASKYEDFWHPRVNDLIGISAESYSRDQMLKMEKTILRKLKFRLNEPTLYVFMLRFLKAAQLDMKFEHLAFYLIELCLVEYEALKYKPSMLCASAIYVAQCTMKITPPWTPLLAKHARYQESQIRDCAEMILKFQKAAKTTLLKVAYEKYTKQDFSRVANIKPLDRLPV
ncbi:hypothetical protein BUALT_Bualt03G0171800 [Buddleja alternifolia]|uniref:B-like cyclin n=1 Tax=Buddleja alternifolia TaxID=168488 RepID=A0AAV6XUJ3_9LAMI|nr:hypothetical protein BUALT_Bualt03G0171800 [Buddleja alternifolia]